MDKNNYFPFSAATYVFIIYYVFIADEANIHGQLPAQNLTNKEIYMYVIETRPILNIDDQYCLH